MGDGFSIGDHIRLQKRGKISSDGQLMSSERQWQTSFGLVWWLMLLAGMLVLVLRLINLQLVRGSDFRVLADNQRIRLVSIPAPRGIIYDRNNQPLVRNTPVFQYIHMDPVEGLGLVTVDREEALSRSLKEGDASSLIDGVDREYLHKDVMAHVLGYVGQISEKELATGEDQKKQCADELNLGSIVGRSGIEETYDCWLRGKDGVFLVEVDTSGGLVRQMGKELPEPGKRIELTIDLPLQVAVSKVMENHVGAAVVSDPTTGEILALYSWPTFDPNVFSISARTTDRQQTAEQITALFQDQQKPMLNRAVSATYPPGSIFKLVTSAGALESGTISKEFTYDDTGAIKIGEYQFRNWYMTQYGGTEGAITVARALARSTDTFFYYVSEAMGIETLVSWGEKFGLGQRTGIDLVGEKAGLMPNPTWKLETIGERWYLGNTYHVSIGQGDLLTTPLQSNMLTNVVANYGRRCKPHLVKHGPQSSVSTNDENYADCVDLEISESTLKTIVEGMVGACKPGGTAVPFFDFGINVACKTGTAEYGPADEKGHRKTHAWFTVFGPVDLDEKSLMIDEKIKPVSITVLVESGGEGSKVAAPLAKEILESWWNLKPVITPVPSITQAAEASGEAVVIVEDNTEIPMVSEE